MSISRAKLNLAEAAWTRSNLHAIDEAGLIRKIAGAAADVLGGTATGFGAGIARARGQAPAKQGTAPGSYAGRPPVRSAAPRAAAPQQAGSPQAAPQASPQTPASGQPAQPGAFHTQDTRPGLWARNAPTWLGGDPEAKEKWAHVGEINKARREAERANASTAVSGATRGATLAGLAADPEHLGKLGNSTNRGELNAVRGGNRVARSGREAQIGDVRHAQDMQGLDIQNREQNIADKAKNAKVARESQRNADTRKGKLVRAKVRGMQAPSQEPVQAPASPPSSAPAPANPAAAPAAPPSNPAPVSPPPVGGASATSVTPTPPNPAPAPNPGASQATPPGKRPPPKGGTKLSPPPANPTEDIDMSNTPNWQRTPLNTLSEGLFGNLASKVSGFFKKPEQKSQLPEPSAAGSEKRKANMAKWMNPGQKDAPKDDGKSEINKLASAALEKIKPKSSGGTDNFREARSRGYGGSRMAFERSAKERDSAREAEFGRGPKKEPSSYDKWKSEKKDKALRGATTKVKEFKPTDKDVWKPGERRKATAKVKPTPEPAAPAPVYGKRPPPSGTKVVGSSVRNASAEPEPRISNRGNVPQRGRLGLAPVR